MLWIFASLLFFIVGLFKKVKASLLFKTHEVLRQIGAAQNKSLQNRSRWNVPELAKPCLFKRISVLVIAFDVIFAHLWCDLLFYFGVLGEELDQLIMYRYFFHCYWLFSTSSLLWRSTVRNCPLLFHRRRTAILTPLSSLRLRWLILCFAFNGSNIRDFLLLGSFLCRQLLCLNVQVQGL